MSKAKLKVEVKTGSSGPKIAEAKPKVKVEQASGKPKLPGAGKPIYKPKAKITMHLRRSKA